MPFCGFSFQGAEVKYNIATGRTSWRIGKGLSFEAGICHRSSLSRSGLRPAHSLHQRNTILPTFLDEIPSVLLHLRKDGTALDFKASQEIKGLLRMTPRSRANRWMRSCQRNWRNRSCPRPNCLVAIRAFPAGLNSDRLKSAGLRLIKSFSIQIGWPVTLYCTRKVGKSLEFAVVLAGPYRSTNVCR